MNVLVLIPPSEGKSQGGDQKPLENIKSETGKVVELIQKQDDVEKLYGVKGKNAQDAHALNANLLKSQTFPAIKRYTGVVYNAIEYDTLSKKAQTFFHVHFRIVSAMFGLVKPNECIPEYKIKLSKLKLDSYWRPILSKKLQHFYVIDLLAEEQRKAVYYEHGIRINFQIKKNGFLKPAGHFGKHIKGRFIRFMCENQYLKASDLATFSEDGFLCITQTETELMFCKNM